MNTFTSTPYTCNADWKEIKTTVISTLAYFDIFNFPLTKEEVFLFAGIRCQQSHITAGLDALVADGIIFNLGDFFSVKNDTQMVLRRELGAEKALPMIHIATKIAAFLIKFPFVKGVAISGSLSKKYADDKSDIDFFIISATNRMWISRTLLHLFKKLTFLLNKQDYFCMNYFVDERNARIVEKNIFTATEAITLIPLQGDIAFNNFFSANSWIRKFLPNNLMRVCLVEAVNANIFKRTIENLLNNATGDHLDKWLMRLTAYRWDKKTTAGKLNARGVPMSMVTGRGYAKPNPINFQQKILAVHAQKVKNLMLRSALV